MKTYKAPKTIETSYSPQHILTGSVQSNLDITFGGENNAIVPN